MIKVSDYIAKYLKQIGIRHVFMVTGGGSMHLNDAFSRFLSPICFHHEQACAIAAEGYARISNNVPIVNVTSGPGGTNAITGVLGAWTDSIPMLIISGQVNLRNTIRSTGLNLRQFGDQECDITKVVAPITKYATMVTKPNEIQYHLDKAIALANEERSGPCWLDIPLDIQNTEIDELNLLQYHHEECIPKISANLIIKILESIKLATRPVLLVGQETHGFVPLFKELVRKLNIPVLTAFNAHDCIENDHPLYAGRPGTIGERAGNFVLQNADLLLVLGTHLDVRQIGYNYRSFAKKAFKIIVDNDLEELKKPTIFPDIAVFGSIGDFLQQMNSVLGNSVLEEKKEWVNWCRERRQLYPVVLPAHRQGPFINPYAFIEELGKHLPEGQVLALANATACVVPFQVLPMKKNQRMFSNSGAASMGYDLPAAIGACFGSGKKVVCLAGDGSVQMNLQELQTIRHYNLPIKIFVLNNNGYHSIRQTQTNYKLNPIGYQPSNGVSFPDMEKIAFAYNIRFLRCSDYTMLSSCIDKMLLDEDPVICEIILNPDQPFSPRMMVRKAEDGTIVPPSLDDMYPFLSKEELERNTL